MDQSATQIELIQAAVRALRSGETVAVQRALDRLHRSLDAVSHYILSDMCLVEYSSRLRGRSVTRVCQRRLRHRGNHKASGRLT